MFKKSKNRKRLDISTVVLLLWNDPLFLLTNTPLLIHCLHFLKRERSILLQMKASIQLHVKAIVRTEIFQNIL